MRFRFQFRLRTLMAVVTLLCVVGDGYIGWQKKIVEERKAVIREIIEIGGEIFFATKTDNWDWFTQEPERPTVSFLTGCLGDDYALTVRIPHRATPGFIERIHVAYPEAYLEVWRNTDATDSSPSGTEN